MNATGSIQRVSTLANGTQSNLPSFKATFSPDGTSVLFHTDAALLARDTDSASDIYLKNIATGGLTLISTGSTVTGVDEAPSFNASFSGDGTRIAYETFHVVPRNAGLSHQWDIFVKNLVTGTVVQATTTAGGTIANESSMHSGLSHDGTKIVFSTSAANLVPGAPNGPASDILVKNLTTGAISNASTSAVGVRGNSWSDMPVLSPDGRKVAFVSAASNLVAGDTFGSTDIFVKDLQDGAIVKLVGPVGRADMGNPVFSPDGQYLAYEAEVGPPLPGSNPARHIFVENIATGTLIQVSSSVTGETDASTSRNPFFSPDGRRIGFESSSAVLVPGGAGGATFGIYAKDLSTGRVTRLSTDAAGVPSADQTSGASNGMFSPDGTKIVFSDTQTYAADDTNSAADIFVKVAGPPAIPPVLAVKENVAGAVISNVTGGAGTIFAVSDTRFEVLDGYLKLKNGVSLNHEAAASVRVTVAAITAGTTTREVFEIAVANLNEAPSSIALSAVTVNENAAGAVIGRLTTTDPDAGNTAFTYAVSDTRFEVVGGDLKLKAGRALDYEAARSVALTVTATDAGDLSMEQAFTIFAVNQNEAPTAIGLSGNLVYETVAGARIGRVTVADPDGGAIATTVSDSRFQIVNGDLKLKAGVALDYEATRFVDLTITATDGGGLSRQQDFRVNVLNINEKPLLSVTPGSVTENAAGATVATLIASDPDGGPLTYYMKDKRFEVVGNEVKLKAGVFLDHEKGAAVSLTIAAVDAGKLFAEQTIIIPVTNVNEAPLRVGLNNITIGENIFGGIVGRFTVLDADKNESFTYGVSDDRFEALNGTLRVKRGTALNFEQTGPRILMDLTVTDRGGLSRTDAVSLIVLDANEAPGPITLTQVPVAENRPGAAIGMVAVSDPDGGPLAVTIDDARFELAGRTLKLKEGVALDQDVAAVVRITLTATDAGGLTSVQAFDIPVLAVAEADTMVGTTADDLFLVDHVGDVVREAAGGGADTISASINVILPDNVEALLLTGTAAAGAGNALANRLVGSALTNTLDGQGGNDTVLAGDGGDTLYGFTGDDSLFGDAGNDDLRGGDGNDWVFGGEGADTLRGDIGTDTLVGGNGRDVFVVNKPTDIDIISDFNVAEDTLRLVRSGFATAEEVYGAMRQRGDDVLLYIPGGHFVSFAETTVAALAGLQVQFGEGLAATARSERYAAVEDTVLATPRATGLLAGAEAGVTLAASSIGSFNTAKGSITVAADGSFHYVPLDNANGPDSFAYRVLDADGSVTVETASFDIAWVLDKPDLLPGLSAVALPLGPATSTSFQLPLFMGDAGGTVIVHVDWGDGSFETIFRTALTPLETLPVVLRHDYLGAGLYTATASRLVNAPEAADSVNFKVAVQSGLASAGGPGADVLIGGDAADVLAGGASSDWLRGNGGSDTFVIGANGGHDVIADFAPATDILRLADAGLWTRADVLAALRSEDHGTRLALAVDRDGVAEATVLFQNLTKEALAGMTIEFGSGRGVVAVDDRFAAMEDVRQTFAANRGLLFNDTAEDGGKEIAVIGGRSTAQGGWVEIGAGGNFTYTSARNFSGTDSFTYLLRDADGSVAQATATLDVAPVYDAPSYNGLFGIEAAAPNAVAFAVIMDRGDSTAATVSVSWGDGSSNTFPRPANQVPATTELPVAFSHAYDSAGNYTASVEVRDGTTVVGGESVAVKVAPGGGANLNGGSATDVLIGGTGADTLTGGAGDDLLQGGDGADVFVFTKASATSNDGRNQINDFEVGLDRIRFVGYGTELNSFADVIGRSIDTENGGISGVGISLDAFASSDVTAGVLLANVSAADLRSEHFIFG